MRARRSVTVRTRMTVLVGLAAALVLIPVTLIAPGRMGRALLDDVFDDVIESQSLDTEALADLMAQRAAGVPGFVEAAAESAGSLEHAGPLEVEMRGFDPDEARMLANEALFVHEALARLDGRGHLDGLLDATGSERSAGVPVAMTNGAVATFLHRDRASATLLAPGSATDPVITLFGLSDLLYKTGGLGPEAFKDDGTPAPFDDQWFAGHQRIAFATRSVGSFDFVVAADTSGVALSVNRLRSSMWLATPLALVATAAVAWLLTGRALRPVERITQRVRRINAGTLGERVPQPHSGDEIDRLAATMNAMLDRLEGSDTRLRQFVSDASHELRTPVAVLRSEAEVALRSSDSVPAADLAAGVLIEAERMQRIVDDLLILARHDEDRSRASTEAIDLDDVVFEEATRRRAVPVDVSAVTAGRVATPREGASRIVAHLLDNAARHAHERVAVSLTTRPSPDPASTTGYEAVLSIDDDGPGIDEADRDRIFERFARLSEARDRDAGGTGLGLAVVRVLVTESGGHITVEDSPSGGARFTVVLPTAH